MSNFMHRYGTPLTAGLFIISTVSGVALFFHWTPRSFRAMHEWLSMLLIAPFALHLVKNWKPLVGYFQRRTLVLPLALCLVVAVPFAVKANMGSGGPGRPSTQTVALLTKARLVDLAPVFQATPETLLTHLQQRGYQASSIQQSPGAIAAASAKPANEVLFAMIPSRRGAKPANQ